MMGTNGCADACIAKRRLPSRCGLRAEAARARGRILRSVVMMSDLVLCTEQRNVQIQGDVMCRSRAT